MFSKFIFVTTVLTLMNLFPSKAWVMTDINFNDLRERNLDIDCDNDCDEEYLRELELQRFSLIYPGTKWCGPGNDADGYDDLGSSEETDMCCREHDYCPDIIPAGDTKYNLTNDAFYTRLNCECDETFRKCLHAASESISNQIGYIYFNALGTQCFKYEQPIRSCKKRGGWFKKKCTVYELDESSKPLYQWFDVPNY